VTTSEASNDAEGVRSGLASGGETRVGTAFTVGVDRSTTVAGGPAASVGRTGFSGAQAGLIRKNKSQIRVNERIRLAYRIVTSC
jgi:hypothetical protein